MPNAQEVLEDHCPGCAIVVRTLGHPSSREATRPPDPLAPTLGNLVTRHPHRELSDPWRKLSGAGVDRSRHSPVAPIREANWQAVRTANILGRSCVEIEWVEEFDDDDLRDAVRRYLPDTVVRTTDWTTGSLTEQLERGVFNVDPPFQRRSAWTDRKASLYIGSLLIGCPVPPIALAELPRSNAAVYQYVVIDGKQRLSTLKRFAVDPTLTLRGLEALPRLNGTAYDTVALLPEFARFANLPIRTLILRNWQTDEVLQFVFNQLNTQVTPLSTHELRRSLLAGPFTSFLDERSAASHGLQRILGVTEPDYRLRDAELLLRGISFSRYLARYGGNLKQFLDTVTKSLNRSWRSDTTAADVARLADDIDHAIEATFTAFQTSAFQRWEEDGRYTGRFTKEQLD